MSRHAFLHVVVANGQPLILTMPRLGFYSTCGKAHCAHDRCWRARERAEKRCEVCGEVIAAGSKYTEHRNTVTGDLVSQQHVTCPVKES